MATDVVRMPLVVHNLHGPEKVQSRRRASIDEFLHRSAGGVGGFNELNRKDRTFFKLLAKNLGLSVYIHGFDGVVWDPTKLVAGKPRVHKIMQGGYVGLDEVATAKKGDDDRRLGPSVYAIYMPFRTVEFAFHFEFVVTHLMSMSFTRALWRQPLFYKSVRRLADGVLEAEGILVGDMNSIKYVNLPGVADVPVKVPPDMGNKRYTQILRWGSHISVSNIVAVNTPSDHHLLDGYVKFFEAPSKQVGGSKKPDLSLPKPGTRTNWKQYGSPVRHPWAERSARWKRRNYKKWARIVKWRAAYRRRLAS